MKLNKIIPIVFFTLCMTQCIHANQNYTKNLFITKNEYLTITSPENGSTTTGENLSIIGTSIHPSCAIRLLLNNTLVGTNSTEEDGSWSFDSLDLPDGHYQVKVEIFGSSGECFSQLASATSSFNVSNGPLISIDNPIANENNQILYTNIHGYTSQPSSTIRISIDETIITTTTANEVGYWEMSFPPLENGEHTLSAELMSGQTTLATETIVFSTLSPTYICDNNQLVLIEGIIPTSGSGDKNLFTYSVAGNVITINFDRPFTQPPTIFATGQYGSGTSTVTITSLSTSECTLTFSSGTEYVHFLAIECFGG